MSLWAQACDCLGYKAPRIEFRLCPSCRRNSATSACTWASVLGDEKKWFSWCCFPGEGAWELLHLVLTAEHVLCLAVCASMCTHTSGGTLTIQWLGKSDWLFGNGRWDHAILLVLLPRQFWPFLPPSLCRPPPSFLPLSKEKCVLFPFMSQIRREVPMKGSRLVPFSSR